MNKLKRTLALMAALAMATTAFVGCGDESSSSSSSSSESSTSDDSSDTSDESSESDVEDSSESSAASTGTKSTEVGAVDSSLGTGGDYLTIAAWNADDAPYLIAQWKGVDYETAVDQLANDELDGVRFVNYGCGGGDASEKYDQRFASGEDFDIYFAEADWALKYINDDTKSLPLEKLGFTDDNFVELYAYTDTIGMDSNGVRKAVSWQSPGGGFAYRADLAEEYLGVTSPDEMQALISDWDGFVSAAETVSEKSSGAVAFADTLGGLWQAYACGRTQPWVVDNKLVIDDFCEGFANTAKALWDCGGITANGQWTDEWTAAGVNDTCMGYFVCTWALGGFLLDAAGGEDGVNYGKWSLCAGPQAFNWGGTWLLVNPATDNAEEAQDFIRSATVDNDQMSAYAVAKPEYVNNTTVMNDLISANTVFNETVTGNFVDNQNVYAVLQENAEKVDFSGLITEYDATIKTDFVNAVQANYLEGGASWEDTQEAFKDLVAEHITSLEW